MQINPRFNFYVRLDGSGRAISGSGVWRLKQPKTGRWLKVEDPDVCCGAFTALTATVADPAAASWTVTILCDAVAKSTNFVTKTTTDQQSLLETLNFTFHYLGEFSAIDTTYTLHLNQDVANSLCATGTLTMTIA